MEDYPNGVFCLLSEVVFGLSHLIQRPITVQGTSLIQPIEISFLDYQFHTCALILISICNTCGSFCDFTCLSNHSHILLLSTRCFTKSLSLQTATMAMFVVLHPGVVPVAGPRPSKVDGFSTSPCSFGSMHGYSYGNCSTFLCFYFVVVVLGATKDQFFANFRGQSSFCLTPRLFRK